MSGHARERAAWFLVALAAAVLAALPSGALPVVLAFPALLITLAIAPGAWLAPHLAPGEASDARTALVLLVSPLVAGTAFTLLRLAGTPSGLAARGLEALLVLLASWEALRPRRSETTAPGARAVWIVAIATGVGLAAAAALHPALAERSDGAFHAGLVWAADRALPPEDPFFAGLPLRYFWGLHAWAAGWLALAPGLGAYAPLVVSSALAAVATLLGVGSLARRLGGSPRTSLLAQALSLAGTAPFAWLVLALRAARGEVRGGAEIARSLEQGADPALRALDPGLLHPSLVLPLDKFVVLTPFAWALAGTVALSLALTRVFEARAARSSGETAVVLLAVLFVHPVAGLALAGAAAAGVMANLLTPGAPRAHAWRALAGIAVALAASVPYVFSATGGSGAAPAGLGFATDLRGLWSAGFGGALVLPWAFLTLAHERDRDPAQRTLAVMLFALVVPACMLRMGGDNQSKFLNLAFVLAAAPAACAWARSTARPAGRARAAALLVLAQAPTLAAVLWAYAHEGAASLDAPSRPPLALVSAFRRLAARDAVIADALQDTTRGAAPALAGDTGRALLWSGGFLARKWGHPSGALAERREAMRAFTEGDWPRVRERTANLTRELWAIVPDDPLHAPEPDWRVEARADGMLLLRRAPQIPPP